jgi:hypothetical protein
VDDPDRRRFLWGAALAWAPWVPTLIGLSYAFRGISTEKATGLGAVAGGLVEGFVLWGIATMIISQVAAIVILSRSFSREHWMRSLFSALSIGLSGLMLVLVGGFFWMSRFLSQQ